MWSLYWINIINISVSSTLSCMHCSLNTKLFAVVFHEGNYLIETSYNLCNLEITTSALDKFFKEFYFRIRSITQTLLLFIVIKMLSWYPKQFNMYLWYKSWTQLLLLKTGTILVQIIICPYLPYYEKYIWQKNWCCC